MQKSRVSKWLALLGALMIGICSGVSANVIRWDQVNVEHEERLARERDKQGALACSLNCALKCIYYGSQQGSWLQIDIIKPLIGPWKVAYDCKEYEQARIQLNLAILKLFT